MYGDSARIKQIMINLLTNSIKYTRSGFVELKIDSVIKMVFAGLLFQLKILELELRKKICLNYLLNLKDLMKVIQP